MNRRFLVAVLLPLPALALQWVLWPWISPFVWFLFYPTVFFSARIGGLFGGLASAILSTGIVWYFFLAPQLSWKLDHSANFYSVGLFLLMGYLFSESQERLHRAQRRTDAALAEAQAANEKISELYRKTLELDELKSQFFANVSHELRTPLTLIMSPLARRLKKPELSQDERREDQMMLRNARILFRHVSDLLDAAKLESGQMTADLARVDIAALARVTASQFETLGLERGIDYHQDIPANLEAEVDGEKVQRILLNLLSNAFKFTPMGGRVDLRLGNQAEDVVIEVQDNGPGVPAHLRETVFERFRQVEGGTLRRFGGTGLGLAIVKEFADLLGGGVQLIEAPGGGALFVVRLPRHAPAGAVIHPAPNSLDPRIGRQAVDELRPVAQDSPLLGGPQAGQDAPLVLVVEDNADMNAFVAEALRPLYRVACALDGREGLERAIALRPDLILCDIMMPGLSGDQMVTELRRLPTMADVPIVVLSAKTDDELRIRMLTAGVQEYLDKPFSVDELLARVGGLINERRQVKAALQLSEMSYRSLFENMMNGFAHCLMLFEDGAPKDFVYLDVNQAFETRTGLRDVVGRKVSDVIPGLQQTNPGLFLLYGRVATGGPPENFETYVEALRMWFSISVYSPQPEHFVAVFDVITERKTAEEALRRQTAELAERNAELERFNLAAVGRELDMIGLKKQVNELSCQLGRDPPFSLAFLDTPDRPDADFAA